MRAVLSCRTGPVAWCFCYIRPHIRRSALERVGGWDPYNVTEDADLGLRLIRYGYRTETLDSDTWEEAPNTLSNWMSQRRRWYKGWLQTWIVQMRNPALYVRQAGWRGFVGLQLLMGGIFLSALAHPILIAALVFWGLGLYGPPIGNTWLAGINFGTILIGHGAMLVMVWRAAADGPEHGRRRWLVPLMPLYVLLHALAAGGATAEYLRRPYHWSKTDHGKTRRDASRRQRPRHKP